MSGHSLILTAVTAVAVYLSFLVVRPFLFAIVAATVLAVVFQPLHARMSRLIRWPSLAALASALFVAVCVVAPIGFAIGAAASEFREIFDQARATDTASIGAWIDRPIDWLAGRTGMSAQDWKDRLTGELSQTIHAAAGVARSLVAGIGRGLLQSIAALVTLFFFFRDSSRLRQGLLDTIPLRRADLEVLVRQVEDSILANMYGVVAVGAAQGLLMGIGMWIAGVPSPVMWGVATAVLSVIPMVGSGLVWAPVALMLAAQGSWGKCAFLVVWGALLVANTDNVVRPWVVGGRSGANPLLVFLGLLGGMSAFGVLGVFIGPVVVTVTATLLGFTARSLSPDR